jgi:hypothetical protein
MAWGGSVAVWIVLDDEAFERSSARRSLGVATSVPAVSIVASEAGGSRDWRCDDVVLGSVWSAQLGTCFGCELLETGKRCAGGDGGQACWLGMREGGQDEQEQHLFRSGVEEGRGKPPYERF